MAPTLTRRQVLAAGAAGGAAALAGGAGLVQAGVLPGRYRVGRLLGACDVGGPPPITATPGPLPTSSTRSTRPPCRSRSHPAAASTAPSCSSPSRSRWSPWDGWGWERGCCLDAAVDASRPSRRTGSSSGSCLAR